MIAQQEVRGEEILFLTSFLYGNHSSAEGEADSSAESDYQFRKNNDITFSAEDR